MDGSEEMKCRDTLDEPEPKRKNFMSSYNIYIEMKMGFGQREQVNALCASQLTMFSFYSKRINLHYRYTNRLTVCKKKTEPYTTVAQLSTICVRLFYISFCSACVTFVLGRLINYLFIRISVAARYQH